MRKTMIIMGILLAAILVALGACAAPASEPQSFPPPEGYSSWDAYYEETGQSPASTTPSETTEQALITKDASELALTLEDFPSGWQLYSEGLTDEGYLRRVFVQQEILMPEPLVCQVKVFSSISEAEEEYSAILSLTSDKYSIDELQVGDAGFAYEEVGHGFRSVLREKNVIGIIDMSTLLHGGSLYEVKEYAEKLEQKIP